MGRSSTPRDRADALKVAAERAADELHQLAHDITRVIDTLPANTSSGTRQLLEQHGRRAQAIAAALTVETASPNPGITQALLRVGRRVGIAVLAVSTVVAVGAGEQAGGDAWEVLKARAEHLVSSTPSPRRGAAPGAGRVPEVIEDLRRLHEMSKAEMARRLGVSSRQVGRWEEGEARPNMQHMERIFDVFGDDAMTDVMEASFAEIEWENEEEGLAARGLRKRS